MANKQNEKNNATAQSQQDSQSLQNALDDAEQALSGDPLQENVQQKKNEQG